MTRSRVMRLAAVVLSLGALQGAGAQDRPAVITPGKPVNGILTSQLPTLALLGGRPVRVYRLDVDSGYAYRVTLRSPVFDSYLAIARTVAGVTDYVAYDDDDGGRLDAMLRFQARATQPYLVLVTTARSAARTQQLPDTGEYTLMVERLARARATPRPLTVGDTVVGDLGDESAGDEVTGAPYALYQVHAEQGHALALTYDSDTLPASVVVGRMVGTRFVPAIDTLPDKGRSLASVFDPPETGDYTIRVLAARSVNTGRYRLRVDSIATGGAIITGPASGTATSGRVSVGQDQSATLAGAPASWTLAVPQSQRVSVSLRSSVFNTLLWVGRDSAGQVIAVDSSDDAPGEETNSRLAFTTSGPGTYVIRVAAASGTPRGSYTLRVDTMSATTTRLQQERIAAGRQVSGVLGMKDAMLTDGSPYQEWIYTPTRAGEHVVITMRSQEFDTYLAVGRVQTRSGRREFVPISVNDDGRDDDHKSNRISRITLIAPDRHDLVIRANTWGPQAGHYTLSVTRRDPDALSAALLHDPVGSAINPP